MQSKYLSIHDILFILFPVLWLHLLSAAFFAPPLGAQEEDLTLFKRWMKYTDISNALYHHLTEQAFQLSDKRKDKIIEINFAADWKQHQKTVYETLLKIGGPFPPKTNYVIFPFNIGTFKKQQSKYESTLKRLKS